MKNIAAALILIGALVIVRPGQPPAHGYVEPNGDFRITQPGVGTSFGYNYGNGVTIVIPPSGPATHIYDYDKDSTVPQALGLENSLQ